MVINAPGINGEKQHDNHRNDPLFKTPKSRRLFRPEEEPYPCGQYGIDERMHPKCRPKMTREQKQYRALIPQPGQEMPVENRIGQPMPVRVMKAT